jgi:ABC-2 type transport system permease protein
LFILQATLAFWTVESLEVMNTVTYGGVEVAQYPLSIYRPWFRGFFTVAVPLAFTTYFPARALLEATPGWWGLPALGVGGAFLSVALRLWSCGVRHYRSSGS